MYVLNPGHSLPFYSSVRYQSCFQSGCEMANRPIPVQTGQWPAFSIEVATGGTLNDISVQLVSESGTVSPLAIANYFTYEETTDGLKAWLNFNGTDGFIFKLPCESHWFVVNDFVGNEYVSERWIVQDFGTDKRSFRLSWTNSKDIDGILYQKGYTQSIWFECSVFDFPEIIENNETETDSDAVEEVVFQSVQTRAQLKIPYIPDFWQGVLQRIRKHDTIQLTKLETMETFDLAGKDLTFTSEPQDTCFSLGTFSWIHSVQIVTGCESNYSLV